MKFSSVLLSKRRAMSDAHDAHLGQLMREHFIKFLLARLVKRTRRLIEERPGGAHEQGACKGDALLLAERKDVAPIGNFIEPREKGFHADEPQRTLHLLARALRRQRISDGTRQRAKRQIGAL